MNHKTTLNPKGITLIELLVALVIFSVVIAGTYRLFISQSRAYTVQDRVVETQQSIRSAMEVLLRDLRMTGFDDDNLASTITVPSPPILPNIRGENSVRIFYEYQDPSTGNRYLYRIDYWRDANSSILIQELDKNDGSPIVQSTILENVDVFNLAYGVDEDDDKAIDDRDASGTLISPRANPIDETDWLSASTVIAKNLQEKVIAVRVRLTARPQQVTPEDQKMMSPRTLETAVTLRNLCLR